METSPETELSAHEWTREFVGLQLHHLAISIRSVPIPPFSLDSSCCPARKVPGAASIDRDHIDRDRIYCDRIYRIGSWLTAPRVLDESETLLSASSILYLMDIHIYIYNIYIYMGVVQYTEQERGFFHPDVLECGRTWQLFERTRERSRYSSASTC